jgi:uncharacterized protein (TIGR02270 family)
MATSPRRFLIELYEEYLEEASFLYEQRRTLFSTPEITWRKIGEFEERLEAHIDGLVVGDKLALEVCARRAPEGDFGEVFAATCVFCREDRRDLVLTVMDQLDPDDAEKASALADALKYELPDAWVPDLLTLLEYGDPKLAPVIARAFGYRRLQSGAQLMSAMKKCAPSALPELVWALGRVAYRPAAGPLLEYLKSEEDPVRSAAAVALARIGEVRAVDYCIDQARSQAWAILPLGLAGGRNTLDLLTDLARKNSGSDCLIALGLLGDPISIPLLVSQMEVPGCAASAAIALECITGAGLYETVFVPDEIDEDELFESEREQLKQGITPTRGDGRPFGATVTRLSQKPEAWNQWLLDQTRFTPSIRYRNGSPISPACLVEVLSAQSTPHQIRKSCLEELVIRYGKDVGIEADTPVARQTVLLTEALAWSRTVTNRFQEGGWYFGGYSRF